MCWEQRRRDEPANTFYDTFASETERFLQSPPQAYDQVDLKPNQIKGKKIFSPCFIPQNSHFNKRI
jgi:hypothetical protein